MHVPKNLAALATAALASLILTAPLMAQSQSWEEFQATGEPPVAVPEGPPFPEISGSLTFYTDQTAFETDFPGLAMEDFSGTSVPPNSVLACTGPIDNATANECFAAGAVIPGFSLQIIPPASTAPDLVILTPPFLGVSCNSVGPNSFTDSHQITFDPAVEAVGLDNINPLAAPTTLNIEVFGASGSLGTTTASSTFPESFWGVSSAGEPITRIEFVDSVPGNENLLCNLQFGTVTPPPNTLDIPVLDAVGLGGLAALLVAAALFALWRRRA